MTISDVVMVVAVLAGPVAAIQIQKWLDRRKERLDRKMYIFRTLMATRAAQLSAEHVIALNMIDIEFTGRPTAANTRVRRAWKTYFDHLSETGQVGESWISKRRDLFVVLLHEIATALHYRFEQVDLRRGCYSPVAHELIEAEQRIIRESLVKALTGETPLNVTLVLPEEELKRQRAVQDKVAANLDPDRVIRVRIENAPAAPPPPLMRAR